MVDAKTLKTMRQERRKYLLTTVSINTVAVTRDVYAQETRTLTEVAVVKGELSAPTGNEIKLATALNDPGDRALVTMKLSLPYGTALTTEHAVIVAGREWNVLNVNTGETYAITTNALIQREEITP